MNQISLVLWWIHSNNLRNLIHSCLIYPDSLNQHILVISLSFISLYWSNNRHRNLLILVINHSSWVFIFNTIGLKHIEIVFGYCLALSGTQYAQVTSYNTTVPPALHNYRNMLHDSHIDGNHQGMLLTLNHLILKSKSPEVSWEEH